MWRFPIFFGRSAPPIFLVFDKPFDVGIVIGLMQHHILPDDFRSTVCILVTWPERPLFCFRLNHLNIEEQEKTMSSQSTKCPTFASVFLNPCRGLWTLWSLASVALWWDSLLRTSTRFPCINVRFLPLCAIYIFISIQFSHVFQREGTA